MITLWKAVERLHKSGKSLTEEWIKQRECVPEEAQRWLEIFQKDDPTAKFQLSEKRPRSKKVESR